MNEEEMMRWIESQRENFKGKLMIVPTRPTRAVWNKETGTLIIDQSTLDWNEFTIVTPKWHYTINLS